MREISVFDVIGPNMIGPSSSHTAGALRIALMAKKMVQAPIKKVRFILYGSFARTYKGHGTDRALLGGILGYDAEDKRIRDSFQYAAEAGIEYKFDINTTNRDVHPNTVEILIDDAEGGHMEIMGESIGGGNALLRRINGIEISITGNYQTMIIMQKDEPGVAAHVTKCFFEEGINIAFLNIYRENKGEIAFSVIEADDELPESLVEKVKAFPAIQQVNLIQL
ncbi:MAG: L-serine ammonia-lyase, iron-sulfur-dependent, subunit beta [Lachnospiraceae bacterium]|nr:L-serine ammonia-lyase, iron-sulfur-dependent, subunit beta [Lachnospiraceae bacterium]